MVLRAIPDRFLDLLTSPLTAVLSTLGPDGSPQSSPVWFLVDDMKLQVSTAKGRAKCRNLLRDSRLSLTIVDPITSLRYIEIRGIAALCEDPDGALLDRIAIKYGFSSGDVFRYGGAERMIIDISPTRIVTYPS